MILSGGGFGQKELGRDFVEQSEVPRYAIAAISLAFNSNDFILFLPTLYFMDFLTILESFMIV